MNSELPPLIAETVAPPPPPPVRQPERFTAKLWRGAMFAGKFMVGALFCQSFLFSFAVAGWTGRFMQRTIYKRWWSRSAAGKSGEGFREHLAAHPDTSSHAHWPNWFAAQNFREAFPRNKFKSLFASLVENFRLGVQLTFNTSVLVLPGGVLMLFGWYDGWNNSFSKGYEQAVVGPGTSLLGIALFFTAMLYVPMAQARQASTGDWRSFYQWRLVWRLVRRRWLACLGLAGFFALLSLPIIALKIGPQYFPQQDKTPTETLLQMTPAQVETVLSWYFLKTALVLLPAYVLVRWLAARIYATGLLVAVEEGLIPIFALAGNERAELERLQLINLRPATPRHILVKIAGKTLSLAARWAAGGVTILLWFACISQLYLQQFVNYLPATSWLNQPLVQLPWITYLPTRVAGEVWFAVFVGLVTLAVLAIRRVIRDLRAPAPPQL